MTSSKAAKKVPIGNTIIGPDTVYKATYSGVPVYELICNREIVMRRRNDDWLNATQFLKVANFDKPQRTRILEREVQKGVHEKIQGGYGKSQGTWVPFERGVALAKQYNIEHLIRPLLEIDASHGSPPPAPKHITAPPTKNKKKLAAEAALASSGSAPSSARASPAVKPVKTAGPINLSRMAQAQQATSQVAQKQREREQDLSSSVGGTGVEGEEGESREEDSLSASPSEATSSSRTPSPILGGSGVGGGQGMGMVGMNGMMMDHSGGYDPMGAGGPMHLMQQGQKRKAMEEDYGLMVGGPAHQRMRMDDGMGMDVNGMGGMGIGMDGSMGGGYMNQQMTGGGMQPQQQQSLATPETYGNIILEYFITEKARIPDCLIDPPANFDPNVSIDDDGHTALHWACAMGRLRVVKLLLTAGADIFRVNQSEQTALMRSVMFSNNYDVRKFPELYQLLHRSTLNIDKNNRTVFHHIADVALTKGKTHAARYYMETILSHLEDFPRELEDVINFQDEDGETSLTLAARARSKRLVRALLDHGADPKLPNRDGKTAEDYILEDERFRSSPFVGIGGIGSKMFLGGVGVVGDQADPEDPLSLANPSSVVARAFAPQLYHSEAAQQVAGKCKGELVGMLDNLASSFDSELQQKEKDVVRADGLLKTLRQEIEDSKKLITEITKKSAGLEAEKLRLAELETELEGNMGRRYKLGWETWVEHQQDRERKWEEAGRPMGAGGENEDLWAVSAEVATGEEGGLRTEVEKGKGERVELFKRFVTQQAEVGTGEKMASYRRLIAAACGGLRPSQVDTFLATVLETLEGGTWVDPAQILNASNAVQAMEH